MVHDKGWSTRWLRLTLLVIVMLATIGTWEIIKQMTKLGGYAHADLADILDCYEVKSGKDDDRHRINPKKEVVLRDQFFPAGVEAEVGQLRLVCVGAVKH